MFICDFRSSYMGCVFFHGFSQWLLMVTPTQDLVAAATPLMSCGRCGNGAPALLQTWDSNHPDPMDSMGFYGILWDSMGFYWILLDSIGFYWILLGSIGFYGSILLVHWSKKYGTSATTVETSISRSGSKPE